MNVIIRGVNQDQANILVGSPCEIAIHVGHLTGYRCCPSWFDICLRMQSRQNSCLHSSTTAISSLELISMQIPHLKVGPAGVWSCHSSCVILILRCFTHRIIYNTDRALEWREPSFSSRCEFIHVYVFRSNH